MSPVGDPLCDVDRAVKRTRAKAMSEEAACALIASSTCGAGSCKGWRGIDGYPCRNGHHFVIMDSADDVADGVASGDAVCAS